MRKKKHLNSDGNLTLTQQLSMDSTRTLSNYTHIMLLIPFVLGIYMGNHGLLAEGVRLIAMSCTGYLLGLLQYLNMSFVAGYVFTKAIESNDFNDIRRPKWMNNVGYTFFYSKVFVAIGSLEYIVYRCIFT